MPQYNNKLSRMELGQLENGLVHSQQGSGAILLRVYRQSDGVISIRHTQVLFQNEINKIKEQSRTSDKLGDSTEWQHILIESLDSFITNGKSIWFAERLTAEGTPEHYVILEWVRSKTRLFIFGAGHIGQCVAALGTGLGYQVMVVDDRCDFASRLRFPDERIELVIEDFSRVISTLPVDNHSVIVIVTRGHQYDEVCLRSIIQTDAKYIGMIGSKKRVQAILTKLAETGIASEQLSRVKAPIGLQIGAKTPQEIGIAIIAEIIACLNDREQ